MKLSDLNKAIAETEKAQKSVAVLYGKQHAENLFAHALNQLRHSYAHVESNRKYEGMSDEDIALLKQAEREAEMEELQEEMKERLRVAYAVPEAEVVAEVVVDDSADEDEPEGEAETGGAETEE